MEVKCKICGTKIDKDTAYKIIVKDKNNYYCNEQEYIDYTENLKDKDNVYIEIDSIFNRKVTHTVLFKEIHELSQTYTYKTILLYLQQNKDYLAMVLNKDFVSEYAQIRYFTAILKNSLGDFKKIQDTITKDEIKKTVQIDTESVFNINYKPQQRKKSLAEIISEVDGD